MQYDQVDPYDTQLLQAYRMTEGISYFGLANLFSFSYVNQPDVRSSISNWTDTIV